MVCTAMLVALLVVATITDVTWRDIHNWTTYPGIIIALLMSGLATWFGVETIDESAAQVATYGIVPFTDSLLGFLACGGIMLVCYVFFPGGVGGGDVKLLAMIGAFLGLTSGVEAMLWTIVLGACLALIMLVWRYGAFKLFARATMWTWLLLRSGGKLRPTEAEREPLKVDVLLSPCALIAVFIVRLDLVGHLF
jgi:Flp pilus assembly protein protease CpaA